jgi:glycosyltransferase involved in cell wall biosynthesis
VRVAHFTATFPPYLGGAGTTAFNLAAGLSERGHDVEVFTGGAPGDAPPCGEATVHRLDPVVAFGNAPVLRGLAGARDFDVLHVHHPFIFGTEAVLAGRLRSRRAKLVVSYHNLLIGEGLRHLLFTGWENTVGRTLVRAADRVCAVSLAHARTVPYLCALERRRPERLVEVPNGVDLARFTPDGPADDVRAEHGVPAEAPLAVWVGTLDRAHFFKRLDLMLDALGRPRADGVHLLVVGGGELLPECRAAAASAGLGDRVHFAGAVTHERLPRLLRAAGLLALSSDLESFGIVLIEAMACGLPVIATDLPGVRAVVDDGRTGLIVPRGDGEALAGAIGRLARAEPAARRAMGAAGRATCEARWGWPTVVGRLEEVYEDVLTTTAG